MAPFRRSARILQKRERQRSSSPRVNADYRVSPGAFHHLLHAHTPRAVAQTRKRAVRNGVRHRSASPQIETRRWDIRKDFVTGDGKKLDDFVEILDSGGYETPRFKFKR